MPRVIAPSDKNANALMSTGDLPELWLYVDGEKKLNIRPMVLPSSKVDITIEGISTVQVDIADWKRRVLRSGLLSTRTDIVLPAGFIPWPDHWFRLAQVKKNGDTLSLIFEDRHVQIMKQFNKKLVVPKGQMTRCEFVWRLFLEAQMRDPLMKDFISPCSIGKKPPPKLIDSIEGITPQPPSFKYVPGASVLKTGAKIYITNGIDPPTLAQDDQIRNINIILNEAMTMKARRKILVVAMMVAQVESSIRNLSCVLKYGMCPDGPIGVFQQFHTYGWPASNDVKTDAHAFLDACIATDKTYPNLTYEQLGVKTQNSGADPFNLSPYLNNYAGKLNVARIYAERIVTAWGVAGGDIQSQKVSNDPTAVGGDPFAPPSALAGAAQAISGPDTNTVQWHRGSPVRRSSKHGSLRQWKPENSWDCALRMAQEVQWYCFWYIDDLHFEKGDDIFSRIPDYVIKEFDQGIDYIDGDYDRNKVNGTVTLNVEARQWQAVPGDLILLEEMGPWDGRWIMTEFSRDLISGQVAAQATITCKKPQPALPEPSATTQPTIGPPTGGELTPPNQRSVGCVAELAKVVETAQFYLAYPGLGNGGNNGYSESRPIYTIANQVFPPSLPPYLDCSGFAATCYAVAGWGNPALCGEYADTTTQQSVGRIIPESAAVPGDLVFWSGPDHVAVYLGGGQCISHGGPGGPVQLAVADEDRYHSKRIGFRSYCGTK